MTAPIPPELSRDSILRTADLIRPFVRRTPVIDIAPEDVRLEPRARLTLKLESLQHAGSFKSRGAFTRAAPCWVAHVSDRAADDQAHDPR